MYPHRIRLRGPWEIEPLALPGAATGQGGVESSPRRVTLPARWGDMGLPAIASVVRFRRAFGLPRRIDNFERVWLTGAAGASAWRLNGEPLGTATGGNAEFEVTRLLRERNELVVEVEAPADAGSLWGDVALEVRCRAYLRGVRASSHRAGGGWMVQVAGAVVSENPADQLELYVLLNGTTRDYRRLESVQGESPFLFTAPIEDERAGAGVSVRVDLVNGATIWHTVEAVIRLGG
jgi:hypothetical protein